MSKPYMFVIKGVPRPEVPQYNTILDARIHTWVIDANMENALERALAFIDSYHWDATEVEYAFEISQEQLRHLHPEEERLFLTALKYGISADFLASPIVDNPDGDVQLQRM